MSAETHLRWTSPSMKGGTARFVTVTDTTVTLVSSAPSPPGSRIDGVFLADEGVTFRVKIHGSKKGEDGTFALAGRPIDMTRDVRERILALLAAAAETSG